MFCVISHIVGLACDDQAFLLSDVTPQVVFTLGVRPGMYCQSIPWRDDIKDQPVFRTSKSTPGKDGRERYAPLPYGQYQKWVKRLGEETGFVQVLTTYCLRRAAGNAINGKPRGLEFRSKSADGGRRPRLERGGAQSCARPRQLLDFSTELSLPNDSV